MQLPRLWALVAICALSVASQAEEPASFDSPADLWRGYDPTALPLEIESLKSWTEDGIAFEKLRFTSEEDAGAKARVFAIQGAPVDASRQPGILHIHGGGQTASLDWVRFWGKRGYVCLTFDFCGPWADRSEVTDWASIKQANMAQAHGGYQVEPTPRSSSWYHWTLASRRALTVLANHPRVDPRRLGIFGISMGGTLCWMVAGSDERVQTAVPIYGCGYNIDRRKTRWGFPDLTPQQALFQRVVSSEANAPYIHCPVLFLDATNDFHGWMDHAYATLSATAGSRWQAFTPRHNHHIAPDQGANLPAWMDWQLQGGPAFPASPTIALSLNNEGVPVTAVSTGGKIDRVDILYSLGAKPAPNRYWRSAKPHETIADVSQAELPVVDTWQELVSFANVHFESGVCLSTNLARCIPAQLGKARATLRPGDALDPRSVAESWFYATAYTDPNVSRRFVLIEETPDRPAVVTLNPEVFGNPMTINIASHILGDPQFAGLEGFDLAFDCCGGCDEEGLRVSLIKQEWTPLAKTYATQVSQSELKPAWSTIVLPISRFHSSEGTPPINWQRLDKIQLQGRTSKASPFRLANLRWIRIPPQ